MIESTIAAVAKPSPDNVPMDALIRRRAPTAKKMATTAAMTGQMKNETIDKTSAATAEPSVWGAA